MTPDLKKQRLIKQDLPAGGNLINYSGEVITITLELNTMKLNVNSALSDIKLRCMFMDVEYFYLNNQMDRVEYIVIQISMISKKL